MPVARYQQGTFASGEFDPLLLAREDVAFYYSSAKILENVIALPQGGAKRREGLRLAASVRGLPTLPTMTGFTYAAPNGGTGSLMLFGPGGALVTTTSMNPAADYVIGAIDCGSAVRVSACNAALQLISTDASEKCTVSMQSSDDGSTYTTRATLLVGTAEQDRRFSAAPDTDLGTHRYWRFLVDATEDQDFSLGATFQLDDVEFLQDAGYSQSGAARPNAKIRRITVDAETEFFAVITDRNVDLFSSAGTWLAAVPVQYRDGDIAQIKTSQDRDTLVLYHPDFDPTIVQRLNDLDTEWRSALFPFSSVPLFAFDDATTGGQNEIQFINFNSMSAGDELVFEFNGEISDRVVWNATMATNVTNIEAALEGLPDIASVTVTDDGGSDVSIEFDGDDANTFFATLIVDILTGSGTAEVSRTQPGKPNQEALWSASRGYPRCGTFYQGRHWMGGFRSRPDVIVGSRIGDFTDFKEDADPVATSPLVLAPDIDEQVTVQNIYPGRNLQIFTSSAELYIPIEPITPDTVAIKVSSKRGCSPEPQPVDVQGGTFFVDRNGSSLREYLFQEVEQSYTAEPISTLGGHLFQNPSAISLRRSANTDEPTILYVVNRGRDRNFDKVPAAAITIDRAQQVTAFNRIVTNGGDAVVDAASTFNGTTAMLVNRSLAGNPWTFLEILDRNHFSDHAIEVANPDIDAFTATAGQTAFVYTFTNPAAETDIAIFKRTDAADVWRRIPPDDYTLDTGTKTITLDTGLEVGTLVSICKRATSFSTGAPTLDGIECYLHADGRAVGAHTPSSGSVTILGDEGFFFSAKLGLRMVPRIVLQAFKGQGGQSPTMQKQRIFRALLSLERTSNAAIGYEGGWARTVALTDYDSGTYDQDLEETLFTGTKRISGVGTWATEPRIEITQSEPGPFLLRSISYDIRF